MYTLGVYGITSSAFTLQLGGLVHLSDGVWLRGSFAVFFSSSSLWPRLTLWAEHCQNNVHTMLGLGSALPGAHRQTVPCSPWPRRVITIRAAAASWRAWIGCGPDSSGCSRRHRPVPDSRGWHCLPRSVRLLIKLQHQHGCSASAAVGPALRGVWVWGGLCHLPLSGGCIGQVRCGVAHHDVPWPLRTPIGAEVLMQRLIRVTTPVNPGPTHPIQVSSHPSVTVSPPCPCTT
jgi:hypothetical protein